MSPELYRLLSRQRIEQLRVLYALFSAPAPATPARPAPTAQDTR